MQKAKDNGYRIGGTNDDKTRADCGLQDEGESKDGGSANLMIHLSL